MAIIRRVTSAAAELLPESKAGASISFDPYADVPFVPARDLSKETSLSDGEIAAIAQALYILDIGNNSAEPLSGWGHLTRIEAVGRRL